MDSIQVDTENDTHTTLQETNSEESKNIDFKSEVVISANVSSYLIKPIILKKRVYYIIEGKDIFGSYEIGRTFKDFKTLRNHLIQQWPACYIPPIPIKMNNVIHI